MPLPDPPAEREPPAELEPPVEPEPEPAADEPELDDLAPLRRWLRSGDTYSRSTWLFGRGLGLTFFVAFASFHSQVLGLVGSRGISPAAARMAAYAADGRGFFDAPTLAWWFGANDGSLIATCVIGELFAIALLVGIVPGPAALGAALMYLSACTLGGAFMAFQWDSLLVEAGVVAALVLPWARGLSLASRLPRPPWLGRWAVYALVARLFVLSGAVKLGSGDGTWTTLTALQYHFWTQPLPHPLSWFAHQLPTSLHELGTLLTLAFEVALPLLILFGRRGRRAAWAGLSLLMVGIALTGNYGFFNLLTLVLLLPLLDDAAIERWGPGALVRRLSPEPLAPPSTWRARSGWLGVAAAALVLALGAGQMSYRLGARALPDAAMHVLVGASRLRVVNGYGLFAAMTRTRREIVIEGSMDGSEWREYRFRYKPRDPRELPRWAHVHMPRLDWQMWFAALRRPEDSPWLAQLERRLLEGSPEVLELFAADPFDGERPRYVRARALDYRFGDLADHRDEGRYWDVAPLGAFGSPVRRAP